MKYDEIELNLNMIKNAIVVLKHKNAEIINITIGIESYIQISEKGTHIMQLGIEVSCELNEERKWIHYHGKIGRIGIVQVCAC